MKNARIIDPNIILRFLTNDDPEKAAHCEALLKRAECGDEEVLLPELILADIIWTLEKFYQVEKKKIQEMLIQLLALKGICCSNKGTALSALNIYATKNIDWTDAYVAAGMIAAGQKEIYSYDQDFERLDDIKRVEPG